MYPYHWGLNHPKEGTTRSTETRFFTISRLCMIAWISSLLLKPSVAFRADTSHVLRLTPCVWLHDWIRCSKPRPRLPLSWIHRQFFFFQIETLLLAQENTGYKTQEFRCYKLCIYENYCLLTWRVAQLGRQEQWALLINGSPETLVKSIKLHGASSQRTADPNVQESIPLPFPGTVPVSRKIRFGTTNVLGFPKAIKIRHFW